jgi:hypothetical protein
MIKYFHNEYNNSALFFLVEDITNMIQFSEQKISRLY